LCQDFQQNLAVFCDTIFSRFRSQPSGNTGGQHDTLRQSFHDANWIEHAEIKTSSTDALLTHFMFCRCWGVFLTWGSALLKCYGPRATSIRHCSSHCLSVLPAKTSAFNSHMRKTRATITWS